MALGSTLVLSPDVPTAVTTNQTTFALRAGDLGRAEYSVAGLTLPNEQVITVSHETGKNGEQRHLVRLDVTVVDAFGVPATSSVYLVIVRPPNTAVTNAVIINQVNQLADLMCKSTNANTTKVLNSEV